MGSAAEEAIEAIYNKVTPEHLLRVMSKERWKAALAGLEMRVLSESIELNLCWRCGNKTAANPCSVRLAGKTEIWFLCGSCLVRRIFVLYGLFTRPEGHPFLEGKSVTARRRKGTGRRLLPPVLTADALAMLRRLLDGPLPRRELAHGPRRGVVLRTLRSRDLVVIVDGVCMVTPTGKAVLGVAKVGREPTEMRDWAARLADHLPENALPLEIRRSRYTIEVEEIVDGVA